MANMQKIPLAIADANIFPESMSQPKTKGMMANIPQATLAKTVLSTPTQPSMRLPILVAKNPGGAKRQASDVPNTPPRPAPPKKP